jgi:prepilin-type N-terminal cleavage/methylation domain-containing protein
MRIMAMLARVAGSRRRRGLRDQRGFTIVETMVAVGIMAVAFLGMASVHAISARAQSLGQNEGLARFVADQQLELMRRTAVGAVQAYSGSTTVQGVTFGIQRTVSNVTMGKKVTVQTTWTDRFGPRSLTLTTIVSQVTNPS